MPRFDPPHYMFEHGDETRTREAQHAVVNLRGHYMGAVPGLGAANAAKSIKDFSTAQKRGAVKKSKDKIVSELRKKGITNISVNNDGTLHLNDPVSAVDNVLRQAFNTALPGGSIIFDQTTKRFKAGPPKTLAQAIDGAPILTADQKRRVTQAPATTFLDLFNPVMGLLNDPQHGVLSTVMRQQGTKYDLTTFPFFIQGAKNFDISLTQDGDELFDEASRSNLLRTRTLTAFAVLFFRKWVELHGALALKGLEIVGATFESLFAPDVVTLTSTQGRETNTPETAIIVDRFPNGSQQSFAGALPGITYELRESGNKTTYFRLSPKGLADRKAALQADYDRKYPAYVQDFKAWHPDFAVRVGFVKNTEGKSESASVAKVAAEYDLPGRFAREQGVYQDARFRVTAGDALGGPMVVRNGPRADLKGLGSLGVVDPATASFVAAMTAIEGLCVALGPVAVTAIVLGALTVVALCIGVTYLIIMGLLGKDAFFFIDLSKGQAGGGQADDLPDDAFSFPGGGGGKGPAPSPGDSGGSASTQSAGSDNTMLIAGGALLLAFFYMQSKKA